MEVITPFWFKQRQCIAEPAGSEHMLKLTGPNLGVAYIHIATVNGVWKAGLRLAPDDADVAETAPEFASTKEAWDVAFELYRRHFLV